MDGSQNGEDEERRAIAALMDPEALAARLAEARVRRQAAIAARGGAEAPTPLVPPEAGPPPAPSVALPAAPPRPAAPGHRRRRGEFPIFTIFVAGSIAGAVAAGIAPRALDLLATPPRPPPGIHADPAPPSAPEMPAPLPPRVADPGASPLPTTVAPAALPERPLATPLDGARIIVNAPSGADATAVAAAMDALDAARPGSLSRAEARVTIGASNVRYFHAADRPAAIETAALLADALGAAPDVRDFTGFTPRPSEGAIEVWLAGSAPARARRSGTRRGDGPAALVRRAVREAREALERAVDSLPGEPAR